MAKKIIESDIAIRSCEGSFKLVIENKSKGKFFLETPDGISALDNSKGRMRYREGMTIEECIEFFK